MSIDIAPKVVKIPNTKKLVSLKNSKASYNLKLFVNNNDLNNHHLYNSKSNFEKEAYQISKIERIEGLNSTDKICLKKMFGTPMFNLTLKNNRPFCSENMTGTSKSPLTKKFKDNLKEVVHESIKKQKLSNKDD